MCPGESCVLGPELELELELVFIDCPSRLSWQLCSVLSAYRIAARVRRQSFGLVNFRFVVTSDRSIIQVHVHDGSVSLTCQAFPGLPLLLSTQNHSSTLCVLEYCGRDCLELA
jgi:hypothetical protein